VEGAVLVVGVVVLVFVIDFGLFCAGAVGLQRGVVECISLTGSSKEIDDDGFI
jgi:hypothetical protein